MRPLSASLPIQQLSGQPSASLPKSHASMVLLPAPLLGTLIYFATLVSASQNLHGGPRSTGPDRTNAERFALGLPPNAPSSFTRKEFDGRVRMVPTKTKTGARRLVAWPSLELTLKVWGNFTAKRQQVSSGVQVAAVCPLILLGTRCLLTPFDAFSRPCRPSNCLKSWARQLRFKQITLTAVGSSLSLGSISRALR